MIERCGDRQRKFDGLQKWPFRLFVESLPLMLQVALLLLACGLCRYMVAVNTTVAYILITLTGLGVLFYIGIAVAGASSYECPFQTPASVPLRILWTKFGPHFITNLCTLEEMIRSRIFLNRSPFVRARRHLHNLSDRVQLEILRIGLGLPRTGLNIRRRFRRPPLPTVQELPLLPNTRKSPPWFTPNELVVIQMRNNDDVRCVSWVLRNITDPEALDAAIRLAGTIRWFENGIDTDPPYEQIISTFHACFGSDGKLYPGSRDRAYYSGRAILWVHFLAACKSEESGRMFPLPTISFKDPLPDNDLNQIVYAILQTSDDHRLRCLLSPPQSQTPSHLRWISNLLLHMSWAAHATLDVEIINPYAYFMGDPNVPLDAKLNHLLMYCNFLGAPVEEEALKVQDKSYDVSCFLPFQLLTRCPLVIAWSRS